MSICPTKEKGRYRAVVKVMTDPSQTPPNCVGSINISGLTLLDITPEIAPGGPEMDDNGLSERSGRVIATLKAELIWFETLIEDLQSRVFQFRRQRDEARKLAEEWRDVAYVIIEQQGYITESELPENPLPWEE